MRKTMLNYDGVTLTIWGGGTALEIARDGESLFAQGEAAAQIIDAMDSQEGDYRAFLLDLLQESVA